MRFLRRTNQKIMSRFFRIGSFFVYSSCNNGRNKVGDFLISQKDEETIKIEKKGKDPINIRST